MIKSLVVVFAAALIALLAKEALAPREHFPIECAASCSPHPMKSFEPKTGRCECQP